MRPSLQSIDQPTRHYLLLDGLRGSAALMILLYHLFESIAFAKGDTEQIMFHGFLAVDFFLILSGFVMGHAYDQRWTSMNVPQFFRRRLIRLHPMVIIGVVFGLVAFCFQGGTRWDGTPVSIGTLLISFVLALFLLPVMPAFDCRGNTELFPLNGPHWSLFFEYIFNVLYALLLHRLSNKVLTVWVAVCAIALLVYAYSIDGGTTAVGWSSEPLQLLGGVLRIGLDYPIGLLLARLYRRRQPTRLRKWYAFVLLTVFLGILLSIPSLHSLNPLYEVFCMAVLLPFIVWQGALFEAGRIGAFYTLLGDVSYPLYAIHYPLIYLYIYWLSAGLHPFGPFEWCTPVAIFLISIVSAYIVLRFYERPVRRWLQRRR